MEHVQQRCRAEGLLGSSKDQYLLVTFVWRSTVTVSDIWTSCRHVSLMLHHVGAHTLHNVGAQVALCFGDGIVKVSLGTTVL